MPTDDHSVTVSIPGLQDIIKIPILESTELRQQRIQRLRNSNSALPASLNWIPEAINKLDDAQDTLIVGLLLARPILRRLPAAILPGLGWLLLANDVLNLGTTILGATILSRFPKRDLLDGTKNVKLGRAGRVSMASKFLGKKFPWLPFILQGGQVLFNYTGYGLQLGTIFGAVTDGIWGRIQEAQGGKVRVQLPPDADWVMRASHYLSTDWLMPFIAPALTWDEIKMCVAATTYASAFANVTPQYGIDEETLTAYGASEIVAFDMFHDSSRAAMQAEGISAQDARVRPGLYTWAGDSYSLATQNSIAFNPFVDELFASKAPHDRDASMVQNLFENNAENSWDVLAGVDNAIAPLNTPWERMMSRMFHENVYPPWMIEPCTDPPLAPDPHSGDFHCRVYYHQAAVDGVSINPFRYPRMLPPLYPDQNWQLMWWLEIALAIVCGKKVPFPRYLRVYTSHSTYIEGTSDIGYLFKKYPLHGASQLVWGNVWSKDPTGVPKERPPFEPIPFCITDPNTGWPRLTGVEKDTFALFAQRQLLPELGTFPKYYEHEWGPHLPFDPTVPIDWEGGGPTPGA